MKATNNTILITGGGSGIGFETAKLFSEKGNTVIITGRNKAKLDAASSQLENVTAIACDVTNEGEVNQLVKTLNSDFKNLNILMNNAGLANAYQLSDTANAYDKANNEMITNYLSVIRLTEKLLPLLGSNSNGAIINVSSVVAFAPATVIPTYSASKAALHSYTQSLRYTLQNTSSNIKVFEAMPPAVDTDFAKDLKSSKITPAQAAAEIIAGLENDIYEIHIAGTADVYKLFLSSPVEALKAINAQRVPDK